MHLYNISTHTIGENNFPTSPSNEWKKLRNSYIFIICPLKPESVTNNNPDLRKKKI